MERGDKTWNPWYEQSETTLTLQKEIIEILDSPLLRTVYPTHIPEVSNLIDFEKCINEAKAFFKEKKRNINWESRFGIPYIVDQKRMTDVMKERGMEFIDSCLDSFDKILSLCAQLKEKRKIDREKGLQEKQKAHEGAAKVNENVDPYTLDESGIYSADNPEEENGEAPLAESYSRKKQNLAQQEGDWGDDEPEPKFPNG